MALSDVVQGVTDFLKQVGDFAKESVGVYKDVYESVKGSDGSSSTTTTPNNTYNPNLTWSDFAFTPNWYLLFGGLALLVVALVLMRK